MTYFVQMSVTLNCGDTEFQANKFKVHLMHFSWATVPLTKVWGSVSCSITQLEGAPLSALHAVLSSLRYPSAQKHPHWDKFAYVHPRAFSDIHCLSKKIPNHISWVMLRIRRESHCSVLFNFILNNFLFLGRFMSCLGQNGTTWCGPSKI